jgi:hypothetical protein
MLGPYASWPGSRGQIQYTSCRYTALLGRVELLAAFAEHAAAPRCRMGPFLISQLLAWRSSVEGRFVYNAREPLSQADVAVVKATIATKRVRLETSLRSSVEELKEATNFASDQRRNLAVAANTAFAKLKQAEADERSIHPYFIRVAKIVSVISLVLAIVNFGWPSNSPPQNQPEHHTGPSVPASQSLAPKKGPSPNNQTFSTPNPSYTTASSETSSPVHEPQSATATTVESDKSTAVEAVPPPRTTVESEPPNQPELAPTANTPAPPSPPAVESQPRPLSPNPAESPQLGDTQSKLSINRPADILKIEQRLVELGYLAISPSDRLNSKSRRALRDFRAANDIVGETIWDLKTETRLFSQDASRAAQPVTTFIGKWTDKRGYCVTNAANDPPLRVTSTYAEASWTRCRFIAVRPASEGTWRILAQCADNSNASWQANIKLQLSGDRLSWSSEKGFAQYYRCVD